MNTIPCIRGHEKVVSVDYFRFCARILFAPYMEIVGRTQELRADSVHSNRKVAVKVEGFVFFSSIRY